MPNAVVDANILIRIVTNDLPAQATKARALLAQYQSQDVLMLEAVVAEVVFVLESKRHYSLIRSEVTAALELILAMQQLHCDRQLIGQATVLYSQSKLDFVDCLVLAHKKLGRVQQMLTFDRALRKAGSKS